MVLVSQLVGLAVAVAIAVLRAEPIPAATDLGWAIVAGALGVVGISFLYRGLAVGRMGIVAPVTGVLAAVIPVAAGVLLEGLPGPLLLIGIAVAVVAVVLVSRVADEDGGREGLREALLAGVAIGLFGVAIKQLSDGAVFAPLSVIRGTQATLLVLFIVASRNAWRPPARALPAISAVGVLDMAGNGFYILAVQTGLLAVASVLSALYPVVTVILATVILKERVTRDHAVGIALAGVAIVCIAAGSA